LTWFINPPVRAQSGVEADRPLSLNGAWETERVELNDGRELVGLVEDETPERLEFFEVLARPGQPLALVRHSLARRDVSRVIRLADDARETLRQRLSAARNRAAIEKLRIRNVELRESELDGVASWLYEGPWFHMEAALPPWEVRRTVIQLEQVFRAFDQVLPATHAAAAVEAPLSVLVFGDRRHYAAFLRREAISLRNPAFFDPARNRVVVSSDLGRLLDLKRTAEQEHAKRLREIFPKDPALVAKSVAETEEQLENGGFTDAQRNILRSLVNGRRQLEKTWLERQMHRVERLNDKNVQTERGHLQQSLFHESFHAYAQSGLVSGDEDLPLWLAEGLAQIFESPQFDTEDRMRIDAPDPQRLARLAADLVSGSPLALADLLTADPSQFLVPHDASGETSERHYLYAWGLAYYLAFEHQ
jgi:hypothetical protein